MSEKLSPPVAICTACHSCSMNPNAINERCGNRFNGKRCQGVLRSAISNGDWKECPTCMASGKEGQSRCSQCEGFGWIYCRR